jgi:hypothetical protein
MRMSARKHLLLSNRIPPIECLLRLNSLAESRRANGMPCHNLTADQQTRVALRLNLLFTLILAHWIGGFDP